MVRASTVGAHLPASGLDIFGDLRKMNKRQVRTARVGAAPRSRRPGGPGFESSQSRGRARSRPEEGAVSGAGGGREGSEGDPECALSP